MQSEVIFSNLVEVYLYSLRHLGSGERKKIQNLMENCSDSWVMIKAQLKLMSAWRRSEPGLFVGIG